MPASSTAQSTSSQRLPNARASGCARAILVWPSGRHYGRALHPCPSVQARKADAQVPAHKARAHHPRHKPQDRRQSGASRALCSAAFTRPQSAPSGAAPARAKGLFPARAEVECIGRGKARAAYEFGCKVSVITPVTKPRGGQFVLHAKALAGNPFDGHPLGPRSRKAHRCRSPPHPCQGYRGHNYPNRFRIQRPGPPRHQSDPGRDAAKSCHRTGDRPSDERPSEGPQLSQRPRWRPHERGARRRRLQLPPASALACEAFACLARRPQARRSHPRFAEISPATVLHGRLSPGLPARASDRTPRADSGPRSKHRR
jgi:hypothetical protein